MLDAVASLKLFKGQEKGLDQLVAQHMRPVDIAPGERRAMQRVTGTKGDRGSTRAQWTLCRVSAGQCARANR